MQIEFAFTNHFFHFPTNHFFYSFNVTFTPSGQIAP